MHTPGPATLKVFQLHKHILFVHPQAFAHITNGYFPLCLLVEFLLMPRDSTPVPLPVQPPLALIPWAVTLPGCFHDSSYTGWSSWVPVAL